MKRRHALITGAVALGAAAAGVTLAWRRHAAQQAHDPGALWSLKFEQPGGGELDMAKLKGKPLLINFWATWCAPCVRELPEIERWYQAYRGQGWQVLGLAVDSAKPVQEYLGRVRLTFPIALAGLDGTDLIHQLGNLQGGLPFSVAFASDGRVGQRKLGETSFDELARWAAAM